MTKRLRQIPSDRELYRRLRARAPGEAFTAKVTVEYNFPELTYSLVGIYDPEEWEPINEMDFEDQGNYESSFEFALIAPDEEGTYEAVADIFYMFDDELYFTEESEEYFNIVVKKAGFRIPGFPVEALLLGLAAALVIYRARR